MRAPGWGQCWAWGWKYLPGSGLQALPCGAKVLFSLASLALSWARTLLPRKKSKESLNQRKLKNMLVQESKQMAQCVRVGGSCVPWLEAWLIICDPTWPLHPAVLHKES